MPVTRSMDQGELETKWNSTTAKVDSLVEEWEIAKKIAEERHKAMESRFDNLARLISGKDPQASHQVHDGEEQERPSRHQVHFSDLDDTFHQDSVETPGYRRTLGNRESMLKKVEMPIFDGTDAYAWCHLVERFFALGRYSDGEKLDLISVSLSGNALSWFNWEVRRTTFRNWNDFKLKLLCRFGMGRSLAPKERLFSLVQLGSIEAYVHEFEDLASQTLDLDDESLEYIFVKGLKPEFAALVRLLEPTGLTATINKVLKMDSNVIANMVEEAVTRELKPQYRPYNQQSKATFVPQPQRNWKKPGEGSNKMDTGQSTKPQQNGSMKEKNKIHLSPEEFEERKRKRLCFKCRDKYFPGHVCVNKELQVITVIQGCEMEILQQEEEELSEEEILLQPKMMQLSLNAFVGLDSPTTTKIRGKIGRTELVIMLDSGATHNFISPTVVKKTKLKTSRLDNCEVLLGNGLIVKGLGICRRVNFVADSLDFEADFMTLELGSADIILGVQWLRTLGQCSMNWETHELSFDYKGQRVSLKGDASLHRSEGWSKTVSMMESMLPQAWTEPTLGVQCASSQLVSHPQILEKVLAEFEQVFREPDSLPPLRGREHAIILMDGVGPISVRPYRYPHAHKEEMEVLVKKMLEAGIIRPSHSSYSSPVLLVKKKR